MTKDHIVRQAARALAAAIVDAEAAGYRVSWPANPAGLVGIGISETSRVVAAAPAAEAVPSGRTRRVR